VAAPTVTIPQLSSDVRLADYDVIFVNSSAGKDSQSMLDFIVDKAGVEERHFNWEPGEIKSRIVVCHADLGRADWPGTPELAEEHAGHYDLPFYKCRREIGDLLDEVQVRKKWPAPAQRYCTAHHKRDQCNKVITRLTREIQEEIEDPHCKIHFLNCFGFRAEEGPRRSKMPQIARNNRISNGKREVHDWLPIQAWKYEEVWARIRGAGTQWHWAYDRGMTRLSCRFCIYAPRSQLLLAGSQPENVDLLEECVRIEKAIDHTFKADLSLTEVQEAIHAGELPVLQADDGAWDM